MPKIVATQPMYFLPRHKERLNKLGDVTYFDEIAKTPYDVICTSIFGIRDKWQELHGVFVSLPFVGVGFFDTEKLKANRRVTISNSPGCNRHAVAEWVIGMMITMGRKLDTFLNIKELPPESNEPTFGFAGKNVTILGKGNIGSRVGTICEALEMNVTYFQHGDDLRTQVKDADVIIDTLSTNPETTKLLSEQFFLSLKDSAMLITIAIDTVDISAMIEALDSGKLSYAAHDAVNIQVYDTSDPNYQLLANHPKAHATPHIAFNTDVTRRIANDTMIDHVEAWLKGKPENTI